MTTQSKLCAGDSNNNLRPFSFRIAFTAKCVDLCYLVLQDSVHQTASLQFVLAQKGVAYDNNVK